MKTLLLSILSIGLALVACQKYEPTLGPAPSDADAQFTMAPSASNANIIELNKALKRIALSLHPRDKVAHLQGQAWCQWLNQQGCCNHFTQGIGQCLGTPAYSSNAALKAASVPLLKKTILDWLEAQKGTKKPNGLKKQKKTKEKPS